MQLRLSLVLALAGGRLTNCSHLVRPACTPARQLQAAVSVSLLMHQPLVLSTTCSWQLLRLAASNPPQAMNLRDLTRKFGRNKGLDVKAVQLFTCQLLIALRHLKKHQILHADIKPDNILINHRHNKVSRGGAGCRQALV